MKIDDVNKSIDIVNRETKNRKTKPAIIAQSKTICPHCGINVIHLAKHIRKVHKEHTKIENADNTVISYSCTDSNENCFRCVDIGFYKPKSFTKENASVPLSKPINSSKRLVTNKKLQAASTHLCEVCQKVFETNYLLSLHRKQEHTYSITIQNPVTNRLSKKKITTNIRDMVKTAKNPKSYEKASGNQRFFCPICKKKFKDKNGTLMHIKAIHALESESLIISPNQKRHPAKLSSSPQASKQLPTYHQISDLVKPQRESKFDGSRDYYNNYRENGKFGSHASHDAYGDEDFA
jgi:transposase-like protein